MDTRNKIEEPENASAAAAALRGGGRKLRLVTGTFDVLLAGHARELELLAEDAVLAVAVSDTVDAVLSLRARAEMVAALAAVRCVFALRAAPETFIPSFAPDEVIRLEQTHRELFRWLTGHVQERHAG